jgi:predicted nuclease with TOPRIM domain
MEKELQEKILELTEENTRLNKENYYLKNQNHDLLDEVDELKYEIDELSENDEIVNEHIYDLIKIDFDKITVSDEMKLNLLLEVYHKCSLEEVQGLLKWKPGHGIQRKINY